MRPYGRNFSPVRDWKSMPVGREKYQHYLASREWAVLKEAVRKRSGGTCERCLINEASQVHHQTYERIYQEPLEDLIHLCVSCHKFLSGKSDQDPRSSSPGPTPTPKGDTNEKTSHYFHRQQVDCDRSNSSSIEIPEGYHVLVFDEYKSPTIKKFQVLLDGQLATFESKVVVFNFSDPNDKRVSVKDCFTMPPSSHEEWVSYSQGIEIDKYTGKPFWWQGKGFHASKFYHFIQALGFDLVVGGRLSPEALRAKNWLGRKIGAVIEKPSPGIVLVETFSYQRAESPPPSAVEMI